MKNKKLFSLLKNKFTIKQTLSITIGREGTFYISGVYPVKVWILTMARAETPKSEAKFGLLNRKEVNICCLTVLNNIKKGGETIW